MAKMTDEEVIAEMQSNSLLNKVRMIISMGNGKLEQAQSSPSSPVEWRRIEFATAQTLIGLVNEWEQVHGKEEKEKTPS